MRFSWLSGQLLLNLYQAERKRRIRHIYRTCKRQAGYPPCSMIIKEIT